MSRTPIEIADIESYIEFWVSDESMVPTNAIKSPKVAAKSSTTIAIKGPSVDSFNSPTTLFLLSCPFFSSVMAFFNT